MFCVVGQKVLRCEVTEKAENFSWVQIGKSDKKQTVPNNRIFETHEQGQAYIERAAKNKSQAQNDLSQQINTCKRLYDAFEAETGIKVRVIDRCFKPKEVQRQLDHLRKKFNKSEEGMAGEKAHKDSRAFSTKPSKSYRDKSGEQSATPARTPFKKAPFKGPQKQTKKRG